MSLEDQFAAIQKEEAERWGSLENLRLRRLLEGALCACCGEPIADANDAFDAEEGTVHKACLASDGA